MRAPARFQAHDLQARPTRWSDAVTRLLNFALITYSVDPKQLARHLPVGFEPDCYTLDDGREVAFISAVPFQDADFHFKGAPFYKAAMGQTNYRAYVRFRGERVVWFFGTTLTGPWVWVPRHLWKLPWHNARMHFQTKWENGLCAQYQVIAFSDWAPARIALEGTNQPMGRLDGFADEEDAAVVLTHPLKGYYYKRNNKIGSYHVWHDRLRLQHAKALDIQLPLFERLGLITRDTQPHSTLIQQETQFQVFLPPGNVT